MKRKLAIIGLDSFSYEWLEPLFSRGYLSNVKRLMEKGSFCLLKTPIVGATPHNWATISTGATFSRHGCVWHVKAPGAVKPLHGFSSSTLLAEPIWAVVSRVGGKSILIDVPQSYPVLWKNVVHVGEDGRPDSSYRCIQVSKAYLSEDLYEQYTRRAQLAAHPLPEYYRVLVKAHLVKVLVRRANGWKGLETSDLYEAEIPIYLEGMKYASQAKSTREDVKVITKFYLLIKPADKLVELYSERVVDAKLGVSKLGSWSNWILYKFPVEGEVIEAYFRFKLLRLENEGKSLHIYLSQIYPARAFTHPEDLSEELIRECGPYLQTPTRQQVGLCGACDVYTFIEELEYQGLWYAKASRYILKNREWDLFYIKYHAPDFLNHLCAYMIDERHPLYDPERLEEGWELWARVLEPVDEIVETVMETIEDGIIVIVSDHGSKLMHPLYMYTTILAGRVIIEALERKGYVVRRSNGEVDWTKSIVRPGSFGYNLSVKGRDPDGIIDPDDFEKTRLEVIEILRELKNPIVNSHIFKLVCRRENAEALGYGGDRCADIFVWPNFGDRLELEYEKITKEDYEKIGITDIGTWEWPMGIPTGAHSDIAMLLISGPGIKKSYRCTRKYSLLNVVPTICHVAGLPKPRDYEGGIIMEILDSEGTEEL